jgi:hypothetical protein
MPKLVNASDNPFITTEISRQLGTTREKTISHLQRLLSERKLAGRHIPSEGEGVWIWWQKDAFTLVPYTQLNQIGLRI